MLGNVWEWTASTNDRSNDVVRGGGSFNGPIAVRVSVRASGIARASERTWEFGFRCVGEFR
jgi:formylglycine-generating enzyme required for sulfatase activity